MAPHTSSDAARARHPTHNYHSSQSLNLFTHLPDHRSFPSTRYAGSKLKLLDWIWTSVEHLRFDSALDLFGGTGCVSYLLKAKGKQVTFNDLLRANHLVGKALIQNSSTTLSKDEINYVLQEHDGIKYDDLIQRTFRGVFFLDHENRWLDIVAQNIPTLTDHYKQALAYFALFQAATIKRPYNLFHRANLYMRTAHVNRSFGNKTTWDKPFRQHFIAAIKQANNAVFDNGRANRALHLDATEVPTDFDLVYIDPPYMNRKGVGVDYLDFYHFLEGLSEYTLWPSRIDTTYKHRPYKRRQSPWCDKRSIHEAFNDIFQRFSRSILVVSYRDNGIPTPGELIELLQRYKRKVYEANQTSYKYVLSTSLSKEILFIAE